ncbi:MAG: hypothetical protein KBT14_02230 [Proteobacteria bacterium]|nr:hypothetical protein [Candidatus Enterousia onthequi]
MKNFAFYFFVLLILIAIVYAWSNLGPDQDIGMFIIMALTALGTCGVTILNVFPYHHTDKLASELYYRKDGQIMLRIKNETNHTVFIGSDKHSMSCFREDYAIWWPSQQMNSFDDAYMLYTNPGDNLAIPPKMVIYYPIDEQEFMGYELSKIKMLVRTSEGSRCWVKNNLVVKEA